MVRPKSNQPDHLLRPWRRTMTEEDSGIYCGRIQSGLDQHLKTSVNRRAALTFYEQIDKHLTRMPSKIIGYCSTCKDLQIGIKCSTFSIMKTKKTGRISVDQLQPHNKGKGYTEEAAARPPTWCKTSTHILRRHGCKLYKAVEMVDKIGWWNQLWLHHFYFSA